ncbi:hypothetical protein BKA62DRAFT_748751 [Auriculariales sp. MPI-PUGE-AT-0066]|nr:hypothetical protein BKA62DRAFT_748751 [Auriculariales sp. MPI-PUGE-AT-0066]
MSSFTGGLSSLWDFNLPPAVPEISDDQFLSLLNSQFAGTPKDPFTLEPQPIPLNQGMNPTANPAVLTRMPPQQLNLSPLQSDDSSPSPPMSAMDAGPGNGSRSRKQSQSRPATRNTRSTDRQPNDDNLKRKASDDLDLDDDDEDGHRDKTFHGDDDSAQRKNGAARRKSTGGTHRSEDRLQKRKEQNRAAQRAFRERKEKHVHDLEEKVAMLEAKSDLQQAENENLRDLLGRLQNENQTLKQSQFTFAVSSNGNADSSQLRGSKSPSSAAAQSASPSMSLIGDNAGFDTSMAYFSPTFFGNSPLPGSSSSVGSPPSQPDLSQYGIAPPYTLPAQSPYTTIAANPLYMSFTDASGFTTYMSPTPSHSASTPGSGSNKTTTTESSVLSPKSMQSMQEIFGTQFNDLIPFGNGGYGCPNSEAEMASRLSGMPQSTLGPPVSAMDIETSSQPISATFMTPGEQEDMLSSMVDTSEEPCHVFPAVQENSKNVTLNDAWERVSKHPQFSECDMDELCALLTAQAKCDGSKPVLEPNAVNGVMEKIPQLAQSRK